MVFKNETEKRTRLCIWYVQTLFAHNLLKTILRAEQMYSHGSRPLLPTGRLCMACVAQLLFTRSFSITSSSDCFATTELLWIHLAAVTFRLNLFLDFWCLDSSHPQTCPPPLWSTRVGRRTTGALHGRWRKVRPPDHVTTSPLSNRGPRPPSHPDHQPLRNLKVQPCDAALTLVLASW